MPAQIGKAIEVSGKSKLTYIGHSQGTSQMFYALCTNQDKIAEQVNLFVALAPVVRFEGGETKMKIASHLDDKLEATLKELGQFSLFGKDITDIEKVAM